MGSSLIYDSASFSSTSEIASMSSFRFCVTISSMLAGISSVTTSSLQQESININETINIGFFFKKSTLSVQYDRYLGKKKHTHSNHENSKLLIARDQQGPEIHLPNQ